MGDVSDEALIVAYGASGPGAKTDALLDELFQRYYPRVALWCFRLAGNRDQAADLAQEVFLRVFRSLDSFRGDARFSTWLYAIARNHCFSEMKSVAARQSRASEPLPGDAPADRPDTQDLLERESADTEVRELMQRVLSEPELRVMTLHFVEELPLDAITRLLELSNTSGAKAYLVSAKRKLGPALARWKVRQSRRGGE
jgi:RNA polymerase sigma-70 factor (ECF subfamily)